MDQVTQSNTASAEESASASEELSSQSEQLRGAIATFKLKTSGNAAEALAAPTADAAYAIMAAGAPED